MERTVLHALKGSIKVKLEKIHVTLVPVEEVQMEVEGQPAVQFVNKENIQMLAIQDVLRVHADITTRWLNKKNVKNALLACTVMSLANSMKQLVQHVQLENIPM